MKNISLKTKQRLQKDFGPIMIPHRPEPCSAMCEFWWNWVMLRTIPSKVCINVLTSPCSYTHFDSMGMIEPHLKLLGPHGVSVWFVSDRTRLSIQSITRVLYMTILQLYMTSRYNALLWNVQFYNFILHWYAGRLSLLCAMVARIQLLKIA